MNKLAYLIGYLAGALGNTEDTELYVLEMENWGHWDRSAQGTFKGKKAAEQAAKEATKRQGWEYRAVPWRTKKGQMKTESDFILDRFDFEKVARVMHAENWTWWNTEPSTPSIIQLRQTAEELLKLAAKSKDENYSVYTGGLHASKTKNGDTGKEYLELEFILTQADNECC